MNVKQLREELAKYPDDMDVYLAERTSDFTYGLANTVTSKEITFSDHHSNLHAKDTVVIIDEE